VGKLRQEGFTLIELLVAVGVFAVLSALAYGGLNSVLATQSYTQEQAERLQTLQLSMRRIQRDLEQIADRPVRDQYGDEQAALILKPLPSLSFTHAGWRNPGGQTRSQLQRVSYELEENTLYRIVWPMLDGADAESALRTNLLDNVEKLEIRVLDQDEKWHTEWPPSEAEPTGESPLPLAVELTLTVEPWGAIRRLIALQ
jgi:general secretion pathway protein J